MTVCQPVYFQGNRAWHQNHGTESTRVTLNTLRITIEQVVDEARNSERQRRRTVENDVGKTRSPCDVSIRMDGVVDPRAFRVYVRRIRADRDREQSIGLVGVRWDFG